MIVDILKERDGDKLPLPEKALIGLQQLFEKLNPESQNELFQVHMLMLDITLASMLGALKQTEPEDEDITNMSVWQQEYDFFNDMRNKLRLHCGVKQDASSSGV